jgi:GntR family transcriptional regulator
VIIHISPGGGLPIYLQIVHQVKLLVASGRLKPADELPPIRVLAEQLTINPNTVARAYLELERAGVVVKRHGTGTYISEKDSAVATRERLHLLEDRADALLVEARHLDIPWTELVKLLRERQRLMEESHASNSKS